MKSLTTRLINLINKSSYFRIFISVLTNTFGFAVLVLLYVIKPFKYVKAVPLIVQRIGHLACNTDLFLRRLQLNNMEKKDVLYIGIGYNTPANKQLLKMFKRNFPIIVNTVVFGIINSYVIRKSIFYEPLIFNTSEHYEFNDLKRTLYFTSYEEKRGKHLLNKMGIDDKSEFICFHTRDTTYLSNIQDTDWDLHDYRNSDINNYFDAVKYIANQGLFVLRMGHTVADKLPDMNNSHIIDYASDYRTDFGDIYLHAKCKFSLGDTAGIWTLPTIFHVPVACVNFMSPLESAPFREGDLFIPIKVWHVKEERFLTWCEIMESDVCKFVTGNEFKEAGLVLIENTQEEILDLTIEMNEKLDGTMKYTEEDERLQNEFHVYYKPHHRGYGTSARIGAKFLRDNKWFLE